MKKTVVIFLLCFCFGVVFGYGEETKTSDVEYVGPLDINQQDSGVKDPQGYRGTRWGMTKDEVKKTIADVKWKDLIDILSFEEKLLGYDATVKFQFESEFFQIKGLKEVKITISPGDEENKVRDAFDSIKKALTQKYGNPIIGQAKETQTDFFTWAFPLTVIYLRTILEKVYFLTTFTGYEQIIEITYSKREIKEMSPGETDKF